MLLAGVEGQDSRSRRLADRFAKSIRSCASSVELGDLLTAASRELGFDYFALLHHTSLSTPERRLVRLDNYPAAWAREFVEKNYWKDDPVHRASRRGVAAFLWSRLDDLTRLGSRQCAILHRSQELGPGDGMTVPINIPGDPAGSCSFAVRFDRAFPAEQAHGAELIATLAFAAARRLAGFPAFANVPHLSRRERQCLRYVAAGKTDRDIAAILGVGVETARQYVKRARRAYDVVTRTQLAVRALRDEWISFDEAIDPRP